MGGHFERGNCNKIKLRFIDIINELETLDLIHINILFMLYYKYLASKDTYYSSFELV